MRSSAIISTLSCFVLAAQATTGQLGDAAVVTTNPVGATYVAVLPKKLSTNLRGTVTASTYGNGTGVYFKVQVSGLPLAGGPFLYHLHAAPVPADGNCTGTLAHLDPYIRGDTPTTPCDPSQPATCQVGDLSGKYGKISSDPFSASYVDYYASTQPGLGSFFGNRSIVFHYANTTRITCANFTLASPPISTTTQYAPYPTVYSTGSPIPPYTSPVTYFTGAATSSVVSYVTIFAGLLAAMLW
ncbi:MAG: hypothetical protein M1829_005820 [Trizodia sp. TS-e1964]|nr:MAG: hypothetical protein M1829_005820 [Trizodia sp. TS-e1964]